MFGNISLKTVSVKSLFHPKESGMFLLATLEMRANILMASPLKALLSLAIGSQPTSLYPDHLLCGYLQRFYLELDNLNCGENQEVWFIGGDLSGDSKQTLSHRYVKVQAACCRALHESLRAILRKKLEPSVQTLALQYHSLLADAADQAEERPACSALEYLPQRRAILHDLAFKGARCDLVLLFVFNTQVCFISWCCLPRHV